VKSLPRAREQQTTHARTSSSPRKDQLVPGDLIVVDCNNDYGVEVATLCHNKTKPLILLEKGSILMYIGSHRCTCVGDAEFRNWVVDIYLCSAGIVAPHRTIDRPEPLLSGQLRRSWMRKL
jgi:hypothetical protein